MTTSSTPARFDAALLESAEAVSQRDIDRVLAGHMSYDNLGDRGQAVVRTAWLEVIDADVAALDLRSRFEAEGRARWSEADAVGTVTVHDSVSNENPTPRVRRHRRA